MYKSLITFNRTLSSSDSKHHISFPFEVAPGTTHLSIRLTFSPAAVDDIRNMLTLSVFDPTGMRLPDACTAVRKSGELPPTGWRGSGHRHGTQHDVSIGLHAASPGYVAGPLLPGAWRAVVDTHMIMPGTPCAIRVEVSASAEQAGEAPASPPAPSPNDDTAVIRRVERDSPRVTRSLERTGRGWYRGDLHAHSLHSDASWDIPDLLAWARERRLDFVTLSDHNTVSGLAQMDAACADDLLTMGGMEFTTFWGHALALGVREWIDWRGPQAATEAGTPDVTHTVTTEGVTTRGMPQIAAEVGACGGLFVIAHPMAVGDPYCTGCQWRYPTMRPGTATAVEVWNSDWRSESRNELGLSLAYEWLNAGQRLALTAGTDNHGRNPRAMHYGFNVVYAEDLSEDEILRAVRAGHLYISSGPTLELNAVVGPQLPATAVGGRIRPRVKPPPPKTRGGSRRLAMMGDALDVSDGQDVQVTARWAGCPEGGELCLVADGKPNVTIPAGNADTRTWKLDGGGTHWCLLTLRGADGQMLALTNPIFFDGRPQAATADHGKPSAPACPDHR